MSSRNAYVRCIAASIRGGNLAIARFCAEEGLLSLLKRRACDRLKGLDVF